MLEAGLAGGNGVACPWHYVWPPQDSVQKGTVVHVQFPSRNLTVTASVQSREPVNVLWLEKSGSRACSG